MAASYGLTPDPWQMAVLEGWLGVKADGKWAAPRCALACPRQNGKNGILEIRELFGMVLLGERFLHTAHEVKTARKAFARLLSFFDNPRVYPELAGMVQNIRRTNGQEAIMLTNGGGVEFIARSKGSGRGFTVDVLVCDEAQELGEDALAALLPTISAAPLSNPQMIVTGTPPGAHMAGDMFARMRAAAVTGNATPAEADPRLCWHEWSVDGPVDLDDVTVWAQANPSIGIRATGVNLDAVADERAQMDDDTFARERLGMWAGSVSGRDVIDPHTWGLLADPGGLIVADPCFAVDMSPARTATTICVAGRRADNLPQVQVVECRNGAPLWVVPWLAERVKKHRPRAVVIDEKSPAATLIDDLRAANVTVTVTRTRDMTAACGQFYDAAVSGQLRHVDQGVLNAALANARTRAVGDAGAWAWNRRVADADITPLVSATLALWAVSAAGVMRNKRTGARKVVVMS